MICVDQAVAEELQTEIFKLQERISKIERDVVKTRKTYELAVKERNKVGLMVIDRNDELCILYEKNNVQVHITMRSFMHWKEHTWGDKDELPCLRSAWCSRHACKILALGVLVGRASENLRGGAHETHWRDQFVKSRVQFSTQGHHHGTKNSSRSYFCLWRVSQPQRTGLFIFTFK